MKVTCLAGLTTAIVGCAGLVVRGQSQLSFKLPTPLDQAVDRLVEQHAGSGLLSAKAIGTSARGRHDIHVITLGDATVGDPDERPALLIVAGIHGPHTVGTEVALKLADRLIEDHAEALRDRTVYIVPCVDADTSPFVAPVEPARLLAGVTPAPADDDRDGRADEDAPADIDGDGLITMMRVADPAPGSGLRAEWVIDGDDTRIVRKPDADKHERPTHALLVESTDVDGDGRFGEDGPGGIAINSHFPHNWPEFSNGAGRFPLEATEAKALVDWMLTRDNITMVLTLGPNDTLVEIPPRGKYDAEGRLPLGIESGDERAYKQVSDRFKEFTGQTGVSDSTIKGFSDGSFAGWAYSNFAVYSFATPVWARPDLVKPKERDANQGDATDQPAAKPETPPRKEPRTEDEKWLAYIDEHLGGNGFVPWRAFEHPQLGPVEIGGFVTGLKVNPPAGEIDRLADEQAGFAASLLDMFPAIDVEGPAVKRLGPTLWRIDLRLVNTGRLPTRSAIGVKARRLAPLVLRIDLPAERLISGPEVERVESIDPGGSAESTWTVIADPGASVRIHLTSPEFGDRTIDATMEDAR